ncbi:hypothetical protein KR074_007420, partial [Drosophila pseudoananassae]
VEGTEALAAPQTRETKGRGQSYRPICLLDTTGKVFERVIAARLEAAVEEAGGLSPKQYGFRKGRRFNVPSAIMNVVSSYFSCRVLLVDTDMGTESYDVTAGDPQGSVLGPLLWNAMYDGILRLPLGAGIIAYADDVAIAFSGKFPQTLCDRMTDKLRVLLTWAVRNELGVNPSKTELVLFSRKYKIPNLRLPKLSGETLSFSSSAKYL